MKTIMGWGLAFLVLTGLTFICKAERPLTTVRWVDLERYSGTWYEIASYPGAFQKDCLGTTIQYKLRPDGKFNVVNECRLKSFDGEVRRVEGIAKVVAPTTQAKFQVRFGLIPADYWIIGLGTEYEFAVVGEPRRKFLSVLSRTRFLSDTIYEQILKLVDEKYFDSSRLVKTPQSP